ncbi:MAG: hypothetical protein ACYDAN_15610 [Candidatus Limnocylindrales bacterium]
MSWDLGPYGLGALLVMSLAFGVFAQAVFWNRATWAVGVAATIGAFIAGLFISEVLFGWATAEDLQPNIDGLSFDEVLIGFLLGGLAVLAARYLARGRLHQLHHA